MHAAPAWPKSLAGVQSAIQNPHLYPEVMSFDVLAPMLTLSNAIRAAAHRLGALLQRFSRTNRTTPSPPQEGSIASVQVEWGVEMDTMSSTLSFLGKQTKVKVKGRCTRCWGSLVARKENAKWTGIKCRVCGARVEGTKAEGEFLGMQKQTMLNIANLQFGRLPRYDNGKFVEKIFYEIEPLPEKEFDAQIRRKLVEPTDRNKLTRHNFPPGSPGLLLIQAHVLLAGVADLSNPDEMSVTDIPDVRVKADGTLTVPLSLEGLKDDPEYSNNRLRSRMGTTMIEAMTAAFACELAMKAICLTCTDEAPKSHDLIELHGSLPEPCRQRIAADYLEIVETLRAGRHTFGQWRYFELNVGEAGIRAMIDVSRAHALGKAARVILDEAVMVGLGAAIDLKATDNVRIVGDTKNHKLDFTINVKGQKSPPRTGGYARMLVTRLIRRRLESA